MTFGRFPLLLISFAVASVLLSPSYSYAEKKKKHRPPAEVARAVRLTTDCEKSVVQMLANDVKLSSVARELGNAFPMENVRKKLQILSGALILPGGFALKERASAENRAVTRQILQYYLRELGLEPKLEPFKDGANVVVEIAGSDFPDEVLEVGAHFDTSGETVPGADDNGSGLSLALEMVDYFLAAKPKRTLRFVFYDLEEKGLLGSKHHVQQIKNDPRLFLGAIVIDMIGYLPKDAKDFIVVAEIGEESEKAWRRSLHQLAQAMFYQYQRYREGRRLILSPERGTAKPNTGDHGSYWDAKLPAIFVAAPYEGDYINPDNETSRDTIDNMHWEYFTEVARFTVEAVAWIAGATVAPPSPDPARVASAPDNDILLEAGAKLIPSAPAVREARYLRPTTTWTPYSAGRSSKADDEIFEEIEDQLDVTLSYLEEDNLRKLWDQGGQPILLTNRDRDRALLLFVGGGEWIIRSRKIYEFVMKELYLLNGFMVSTGTADPMFVGRETKKQIRDLAAELQSEGARNGPPIDRENFRLHRLIPEGELSPRMRAETERILEGELKTLQEKRKELLSRSIILPGEDDWGNSYE